MRSANCAASSRARCSSAVCSARAASASFPERSDSASFPFPDLVRVAPFHRGGRDFYFATCAVDFAAFAFVLLFYQLTVHADAAGEALVETYHQGLFPIDYVLATTSCLALVVLDRVLYLHKAHVLKTAYHFLSFAFFSAFTFKLYHHHGALTLRATETGRDGLLRVFFLLKSCSFALNARQVRSGYKRHGHDGVYSSPASSASRVDALTYLGSALYFATPFLYELRVLLDYACVDSSLDLHDWLKLENIKRDLRKCDFRNRNARARRRRVRLVALRGAGAVLHLLHLQPAGGGQPGVQSQPEREHKQRCSKRRTSRTRISFFQRRSLDDEKVGGFVPALPRRAPRVARDARVLGVSAHGVALRAAGQG